jgi:hypothetical protein
VPSLLEYCVKRIAQYWIHAKWKQTRSKYLFNELNNWLSLKCHFPSPSVIYNQKNKSSKKEGRGGSASRISFCLQFLCFLFVFTLRADTVEGWWLSRCEMMITSAIVCWSFDAQLAFCCLSFSSMFLLWVLVSKFTLFSDSNRQGFKCNLEKFDDYLEVFVINCRLICKIESVFNSFADKLLLSLWIKNFILA